MRLLNAEEFKKEPYGTVYCMYEPQIFINQLKIKSEPRGEEFGNSWYAINLIPWAMGNTSQESFKELLKGKKTLVTKSKQRCFVPMTLHIITMNI